MTERPLAFSLRAAQSGDADLVYIIKYEAYAQYAIQSRGFWDEDFQRRYTSSNLPYTQLIVRDAMSIGWVAVKRDDHAFDILDIHLLPPYQRQGIGAAVIRQLQAEAAEAKQPMKLSVLKINPSRGLYERLGFVLSGETESHWLMEWTADSERPKT